MTLNTYAAFVKCFTIGPRSKKSDSTEVMLMKTLLMSDLIPTGMDRAAANQLLVPDDVIPMEVFEASLEKEVRRILPGPRHHIPELLLSTENPLTDKDGTFLRDVTLLSGQLWVGHDQGSTFEGSQKVWLNQAGAGNVFLGGVYYHKHAANFPFQDYHELRQLRDLAPLGVSKGCSLVIDRDLFNIDWYRTFNAWDCEFILIVDE